MSERPLLDDPDPGTDRHLLAIDIGGTKTAVGVVSIAPGDRGAQPGEEHRPPQVGDVRVAPTPTTEGARGVLDTVISLARGVLDDATTPGGLTPPDGSTPPGRLTGVAIASAGVIDPATGTVTAATDALPGWMGTCLVAEIGEALGLPAAALNDVHAHGLGEALFGAGQGAASVLLVAVGTGVGGALVLNGRVHSGARHVAGHVGHVPVPEAEGMQCSCGRVGHLEAIGSGVGLARHFTRLVAAGGTPYSGRAVLEAAHDPSHPHCAPARETAHRAGRAVGRVIGGLLNTLDPDVVVLTGGVTEAGPRWLDAVRSGVAHDALGAVAETPVVLGTTSHAALLGAAAHFIDQELR